MREVCKSGAVVAAVVAVLEKQSKECSLPPKLAITKRLNKCAMPITATGCNAAENSHTNGISINQSDFINRSDSREYVKEENFESAVKNFNSVAEDVEKTFSDEVSKGCHQRTDSLTASSDAKVPNKERLVIDNGKLKVIGGCFDYDSDSLDEQTSDSEGDHFINGGLATITEEERISSRSSKGCEDDDSSLEDGSTLKEHNEIWSDNISNRAESTSDLSTTSSERNSYKKDTSSTRCTNDFQWIRKTSSPLTTPRISPNPSTKMEEDPYHEQAPLCIKPPLSRAVRERTPRRNNDVKSGGPGSLDRRRHSHKREERDQKSKSQHVQSPPRLDDYQNGGYCYPPAYGLHDGCFENFHRRHERLDPQRYGSTPMLLDHRLSERGSHPDIYGDCTRLRHEISCCSYHLGPPPCCCFGDRGYHWTPPSYPKSGDQDEKCRKLQYERDNLQLQVQVLTEQIEAQSDKIADLEKSLQEKKQVLADAEEKLQREVLSRSSLETQKLELMSIMSELKLNSAALERENMELRNGQFNNNSSDLKRPPLAPKLVSQPQLTSTPVHHSSQILRGSPSPSPIGTSSNSPRRVDMVPSFIQEPNRPKTPPSTYKRQIDVQYGSLPRQQFLSNGSGSNLITDSNANPHKKGVAFGRTTGLIGGGGYLPVAGGRLRGFSVPNLAESDKIAADEYSKENSPGSPTLSFNKNKGIKKIFGKMKRSGSGNLEDLPAGLGEFQRGGVRATAAARLGWSEPHLTLKPDKPFSEWDGENICDWLQDLGLDQYIPEAKRWVKSGQQLQESPISEIEKELNIKNPLHRKKLQLALIDTTENSSSDLYLAQAGKLDTAWVLRWLDDTGLPQHKESFLINRVDGRVLHRLTIDDLALLHVTSLLHVASIKRGIQVLRENNYEPTCLQRRSLPDDPEKPTPKHVSLWTTHRVMEWLRAVDLAEYAPNLRGAGVHGGLMVLEPKFNADLLASLLSIPPGKTLLRRHLNTHFKELLGKDIIQEKRETEATMGYTPLTPSAKLKVTKKTQFSLKRKKSKGEADYGDLVCPLNPEKQSGDLSSSTFNMGTTKMKGNQEAEDAYPRAEKTLASRSLPTSVRNSPVTLRHV